MFSPTESYHSMETSNETFVIDPYGSFIINKDTILDNLFRNLTCIEYETIEQLVLSLHDNNFDLLVALHLLYKILPGETINLGVNCYIEDSERMILGLTYNDMKIQFEFENANDISEFYKAYIFALIIYHVKSMDIFQKNDYNMVSHFYQIELNTMFEKYIKESSTIDFINKINSLDDSNEIYFNEQILKVYNGHKNYMRQIPFMSLVTKNAVYVRDENAAFDNQTVYYGYNARDTVEATKNIVRTNSWTSVRNLKIM